MKISHRDRSPKREEPTDGAKGARTSAHRTQVRCVGCISAEKAHQSAGDEQVWLTPCSPHPPRVRGGEHGAEPAARPSGGVQLTLLLVVAVAAIATGGATVALGIAGGFTSAPRCPFGRATAAPAKA